MRSRAAFLVVALLLAGPAPVRAHEVVEPATQPQKVELPCVSDHKPRDFAGLHNVVAFHDGYLSGSVPEGHAGNAEAGFDTLAAMGVKTIISVDGAEPNVAAAKARGMRYIHLPIGYNGFDQKRKLELVRATRDAIERGETVYIHCHHGRHRSAGAAGAVVASLGWLTPEQAIDRMKVSGTAPNYKGLYSCTANATVLDAKAIDAVAADFPEVSKPASFVKAMIEIDEINERLKAVKGAEWRTPAHHPDLVPVAEAARMADLFRLALQSEKDQAGGRIGASRHEDFLAGLAINGAQAQTLEDLLALEKPDTSALSAQFRLIQASCKDCHVKHRD